MIIKKLKEKIRHKKYLWIAAFVLVFLLGLSSGYLYFEKTQKEITPQGAQVQKDIYLEFLSEAYDKIKAGYWDSLTDEQLGTLFKLGVEKLSAKPTDFKLKTKDDFKNMVAETLKIVKEDKKKEFATMLLHLVLQNLKPLGRSALYTTQDQEKLANRVKNINPETNLYETLGISEGASQEEIKNARDKKVAELEPKKDTSEEAKKELEQVNYAYDVLSNSAQKQRYDQTGVEPTVIAQLVRPDILHLYIKKVSPTTLNELKKETEKFDNITGLNSLILDLRANVGGSLDMLPYLLGPFIGNNQYAYEIFHQGENTPYKTKTGWFPSLVRYKKVVILIDNKTQSSAEVMAATLKKYNAGILVGATTRGWGTIEGVINIENQISEEEKYSIFLVQYLTLREDGKPIEENGVNPTISINDPGWESQLMAYFNYNELVKTVKEIWSEPPENI